MSTVKEIMTQSMTNFATEAYKRFVAKDENATYTIEAQATADSGYLATYQLQETVNGVKTAIGDKINIPKDYLVKSADVRVVETDDTPVTGYVVGQKYIDFTVNTVGSDGNVSHLYILFDDLMTPISAGNGIDVSVSNVVSVKIDTTNANGLDTTSAGLKLGLASASANGALSSTDWSTFNDKQEQIAVGTATGAGNVITGISLNADDKTIDVVKGLNAQEQIVVGSATGDGNVITSISLNADNKTIDIVKGVEAVPRSEFEALTAAECRTIFDNAKTAAAQAAQSQEP